MMTHVELLNKIEKDSLVMRHELEADENAVFTRLANLSNAVRAVVELHKPLEITLPDGSYEVICICCSLCSIDIPYASCPTIQAIEKELH